MSKTTPDTITRSTPFPWTVIRDVTLEDGTVIVGLRITAIDDGFAEGGDWHIDGVGHLFHLGNDRLVEAMDAASDILSSIAADLEDGVPVPVIA